MAENLILTRGLYLPDANFLWPIGDSWSYSGFTSADFFALYPEPLGVISAGRALSIDIDGTTFDKYIESAFTPSGIAAGPFDTGMVCYWWSGITVRELGVAGANTNQLIRGQLYCYDVDDNYVETIGPFDYADADGNVFKDGSNFALYFATATKSNPSTTVRKYKLRLYFQDDSVAGGGDSIQITWAGVGTSITHASPYYDKLATFYAHDAGFQSRTGLKWHSPESVPQPYVSVRSPAAQAQTLALNFPAPPGLTEADKEILRECYYWNTGTPTDDIEGWGNSHSLNRGTPQPVIVAMNREGVKRAFYADFAGPLVLTQATPQWWPDTNARWTASLNLRERL